MRRGTPHRGILGVLLASSLALLGATYSQPFASGHGFAPTQSGACDSSYTDASDATNGNPAASISSTCIGRNDSPTTTWHKTLTWESMGVTAGNIVTQVDCAFDHAIITRSHSSAPGRGPCQIFDSANTSACTASDLEALSSYSSGTGGTSWATDNATGAAAVNGSCSASSTSVTVRVAIRPTTGNNASANTQVNVDNLVLTITEATPSGKKLQVIIALLPERTP